MQERRVELLQLRLRQYEAVLAVPHAHALGAADLEEEVVLRVQVEGRHRAGRGEEDEPLAAAHGRKDRPGLRRGFVETAIEQRAVFRVLLQALQHHPGAALRDPPHRLFRGEAVAGSLLRPDADRERAGVVLDEFLGQTPGQFHQPRQREGGMPGQAVPQVEGLAIEVGRGDLAVELDQGSVHQALASRRRKWSSGTSATVSAPRRLPVAKKIVCISRRWGQRWLIMKRLGAAQESIQRSAGSWCARSTLSSSSSTPGEKRPKLSSKVILKAKPPSPPNRFIFSATGWPSSRSASICSLPARAAPEAISSMNARSRSESTPSRPFHPRASRSRSSATQGRGSAPSGSSSVVSRPSSESRARCRRNSLRRLPASARVRKSSAVGARCRTARV